MRIHRNFISLSLPPWAVSLCGLTGAALLLSGVVCFFAFNWAEMGSMLKLGLPLLGLAGCAFAAYVKGLPTATGKVFSFAAGVFIGIFWAVYGQVYQTGAFVYEFFGGWSGCLLPLAILAGNRWLWLLWAGLLNGYFISAATDPHFTVLFWQLFLLNAFGFVAAEYDYHRKKQGGLFSLFFLIAALSVCMLKGFDTSYFFLSVCLILLFGLYAYAKRRGATQLGLCALALDVLLLDLLLPHLQWLWWLGISSFSLFVFIASAWGVYMLAGQEPVHE